MYDVRLLEAEICERVIYSCDYEADKGQLQSAYIDATGIRGIIDQHALYHIEQAEDEDHRECLHEVVSTPHYRAEEKE